MPLKKCSSDGKSGWKWGDSGKCYTGKDGKKKAIKQGVAIEGPDKFKEKASKNPELKQDLTELLLDLELRKDEVSIIADTLRLNVVQRLAVNQRRIDLERG